MSNDTILNFLRRYQKTSRTSRMRRSYLRMFETKMIYRTTKTENPQTTRGMVKKVLQRH